MPERSAPLIAGALEVIDKGTCTAAHPVPLLFVHGAWHGAWCWDEHFLDFFADRGFRAVAVSLRGHGNSPVPKAFRRCSGADYVDDVRSVADALPTPPVLIGHSMGGYVVQKYLETATVPAGILLAALSVRGLNNLMLRLMKQHPWLMTKGMITGRSLEIVGRPARTRERFFSAQTPEDDVARCVARLREESQRILFDAVLLNPPRPQRVRTPMLVLAAEYDGCLTVDAMRDLARSYGTEAEIFPGMGHDMMLEPGWAAVADRIEAWLAGRGL
ncbi:alpha/beta hydrolase [Mycobacterium colombiense]|uniref:Alpha/beta hydrolase n=2 Tax=Mycobacterium colombiense TaxID=339268 RepID=A0A1A2YJ28_9MYCO|nr:alpha/beta hydrolase [Mycobacterium colombiense]